MPCRAFRFPGGVAKEGRGARPRLSRRGPERYVGGRPRPSGAGSLKWRWILALKPNDGETFLKEVDEELRRERINNFFTRYGWWVIGAVLLVLASVGGWLWWSSRQASEREGQGENLVAAMEQLGRGSGNAANPQLDALANGQVEGYRVSALFARATAQADAGNIPAAIATLRSIGDDQNVDQVYRDAALVRRTQLEFDTLQPQEVIRRLGPLAAADSAWLGTAGEMVGVAHLRMNRPDLAGPIFVRIAQDDNVPGSLKARAEAMAGSLGFDVSRTAPDGRRAPPRPRPPALPATPAPTPAPAANRVPAPIMAPGAATNTPAPAPAPATREKAR